MTHELRFRSLRRSRISIAIRVVLLGAVFGALGSLAAVAQEPPRPPHVVQAPPRSAQEQQKLFHLPEGFRIELVASEPEVVNPINLNFDAAGRLYVSQSIEYPIPAPDDRVAGDAIKRIVDGDGDGVPETVSTFADGLNIPIGVTPVKGGVLGYSVPRLYFFEDADGDGSVDRRKVRFGDFGFNDTHGMISSLTWWIDGWVYGCHGFVNTSEVSGTDDKAITMVSGNTYRLRPDGMQIEHFAHGQVNPFGLAIDRWGNVFTADCHTRPATMLLRGAHYPRSPGDGLGLGPELMRHSHGSTGIAGIVAYSADHFPKEYRGTLLLGNPITGRINHDRLERQGSTLTAVEQADFLSCDDGWFRPVDLQLGPDGCLYIADMYNRIIGHYEVPLTHPGRDRQHGRIWRVSYVGKDDGAAPLPAAVTSRSPDLTRASTDELINHLADANLVIRTHATHQLVERVGNSAVAPARKILVGTSTETQRAHAIWVLQRTGALTKDDWQPRISESSPLVRLHTTKVLAEMNRWDSVTRQAVLERLQDDDGFVRRAAVDALARQPHESSVDPLLELLRTTDPADVSLIHVARMALRDTLQALDRFGQLAKTHAGSEDDLRRLADVAVGIPSPSSAEFLWHRFRQNEFPSERMSDVLRHVIRYIEKDKLPDIESLVATYSDKDEQTQIAVASALNLGAQERGITIPKSIRQWGVRIVRPLLAGKDVTQIQRGIELASQMRLTEVAPAIVPLCLLETPHPAVRIPALQAMMAINPEELVPLFFAIVNDANDVPALRRFIAEKLANRKEPALRQRILEMLPSASQTVAVGLGQGLIIDRQGVVALLSLVEQGKVSRQVLQNGKIQRLLPLVSPPEDVARMKALIADLPSLDARVDQAIAEHRQAFRKAEPDASRGAEIFRKTCAVCHRLENDGAKVGPELDGIGQRGVDRLLEDILDPNRTVDKTYRATIVLMQDGRVHTGLVTGQEGQILLLADQTGKVQRIPLSEIDQRRLIEGSAMPANVSELLKPQEIHDLLAFLLTKAVKSQVGAEHSVDGR